MFNEYYVSLKLHVLIRFGKWEEIMQMEQPDMSKSDLFSCTIATSWFEVFSSL